MAVRFDADGEDYTRALSLGSQSALTVACWFKVSADRNTWSSIFFIDSGQVDNWGMQTAEDGVTMNAVMDASTREGMGAVTVGTWYFVCLATSGTTGSLYYKAASASGLTTQSITGASAVTADTLRLGESPWGGEWLNGCLAAVRVWNAQLSAAEVQIESAQYIPNRLTNLVSFHPLVRPETADYSGNGRTLSGGTGTSTEDGPPIPWRASSPRLILPTTSSGITGTASPTQADATSTASGVLGYTGTVAVTQAAQTSTATGNLGYAGSVSATQANQTSTASGVLRYTGTVAVSQDGNTSSASGLVGSGFIGSAAVTQASQTSTASGVLRYSGTVAVTQAGDAASASGRLGYTGTLSVTQASQTSSVTGLVANPVTGTASPTQANQTSTATGTVTPLVLYGTAHGATGAAPTATAGSTQAAAASAGSMTVPTATGG